MVKKISIIVAVILVAGAVLFTYFHTYREKALETAYSPSTTDTEPGIPETAKDASATTSISILPSSIVQGSPVLVTINSATTSDIRSITFQGKSIPVMTWQGKPAVILSIDLRATTGTYPLTLTLKNGSVLKKNIVVGKRSIAQEELGIPDKLGGNTQAGVSNVTSTLVKDNQAISTVKSGTIQLWNTPFSYPVKGPITITDPYGDTRITVGTTIAHKGADFRAPIGTPIYAMNSGKVGFASFLNTYGNTIVIDHGKGLQTIYMHLSEFSVKVGDTVNRGDLIGKSGDTGYVLGPHLHLSIKVNGVSIDPIQFMAILGQN